MKRYIVTLTIVNGVTYILVVLPEKQKTYRLSCTTKEDDSFLEKVYKQVGLSVSHIVGRETKPLRDGSLELIHVSEDAYKRTKNGNGKTILWKRLSHFSPGFDGLLVLDDQRHIFDFLLEEISVNS